MNDNSYMMQDENPCDGDYTIQPTGPLGSRTLAAEVGGRWAETFDNDHAAMKAIRGRMEDEKFFPNVWRISDHGNVELVND